MGARQRRLKEKRLRRQLATGAGVTIGATLLAGGSAEAACTCTVDSLQDPTEANHTTLRDAITSAEANAGADTITFASGLSGTITLGSDLPAVSQPTTIQGPGADQVTISGDNNYRIFNLDSSTDHTPVSISGLTLTRGFATTNGAGINVTNVDLTLSSSILTGNGAKQLGGAICLCPDTASALTLRDSLLAGNGAGAGGALADYIGPFTIERSSFIQNYAYSRGGAIYFDDTSGPSTIENSTLANNYGIGPGSRGGGLYSYGNDQGLTLKGSTVADNSATDAGGGIFAAGHFSSPPVVLQNSIVGDNTAPGTHDLVGNFDSAFSLIESTAGATINDTVPGSSITGQDPQLQPFGMNGGPTPTLLPAATSPVINKGSAFGLSTDQRGQCRPLPFPGVPNSTAAGADGSDMGAVELQSSGVACSTAVAGTTPIPHKKKCKRKKHRRSAESAKKKKCKKKKKRR